MTTFFASVYDSYRQGNYSQPLSPLECIDAYSATYVVGRRNLLAITTPVAGTTRMMPRCVYGGEPTYPSPSTTVPWNGSSVVAWDQDENGWMCLGYDAYYLDKDHFRGEAYDCDAGIARNLLADNGTWYLLPGGFYGDGQVYPIEYCLSEVKIPEKCELQYSSYILGVVVACNVIKVGSMLAATLFLWNLDAPIFATVGDAVASFLRRPDMHTAGWCLMGRRQVKVWSKNEVRRQKNSVYDLPRQQRLFMAVSKTRWWTTIGLCMLYLATGIVTCYLSVQQAT